MDFLGFILGTLSCSTRLQSMGALVREAELTPDVFVMRDDYRLPYRVWQPTTSPSAVLLALHGFNDYSRFFEVAGRFLARRGIVCYAYDQRGFGESAHPGIWPGTDTLIADMQSVIELLRQRHRDLPLYVLGESMGGAVILASMLSVTPLQSDGVILVAPAVWGRATMPSLYQMALWFSYSFIPSTNVRPPRGLKIYPSDNIEMLQALGRDPLAIKQTRVDTLHGLVDLMDDALDATPFLSLPTLLMYGANEQVIPRPSIELFASLLPQEDRRVAVYPQGFHMLLRDLNADIPLADIVVWIEDPQTGLPSGAEVTGNDWSSWRSH